MIGAGPRQGQPGWAAAGSLQVCEPGQGRRSIRGPCVIAPAAARAQRATHNARSGGAAVQHWEVVWPLEANLDVKLERLVMAM